MTTAELQARMLDVKADPSSSPGARVGAFETWFRQAAAEGAPPDALRRYCADEAERFWSYVIDGADHSYWDGPVRFVTNAGRYLKPCRWVVEQRTGRPLPNSTDVWTTCGESSCVAYEHLAAGRSERRLRFSDQALIGSLQVVVMRQGRLPSMRWWDANSRPTAKAIVQRFGSWEKFLRAGGYTDEDAIRAVVGRTDRVWTDEELIAGLRALAKRLGRVPTSENWRENGAWAEANGYPRSQNTLRRHLGGGHWRRGGSSGSWRAALKRAGLA